LTHAVLNQWESEVEPVTKAERDIRRKLAALKFADEVGNVALACRRFGITRQCFYNWRRRYQAEGEIGLANRSSRPHGHPRQTPPEIEEKILHLRHVYHFGPDRIAWYLERYHGFRMSASGVHRVLQRNGVSRLPSNCPKRSIVSKRYEKQVPGHHVQVDVKFLQFVGSDGRRVKRYQFTAIDDATRIRALKIYDKHTQASAIDFIDHVVERFPFRIHTIRTDNGHEFQAMFHWHVEDLGMRHVYIKPRSPNLNGKVERSHLTDELEFYQLLEYTDDVDLRKKLAVWEEFYNFNRPHSALKGRTPYEVLRDKLIS
jgi:transposase InsO family protein